MALLIKNSPAVRAAGTTGVGQAIVSQWIHVARPTAVLPQSTTEWLFQVHGGRILVLTVLGEVTVVMTATDPLLSFNHTKLDAAGAATVGTTKVFATTATLASAEVGRLIQIEGDGTALVSSVAGGVFLGIVDNRFILPRGEFYATTTASNTTGSIKWDMWYQPLDEGAYVTARNAGTAII